MAINLKYILDGSKGQQELSKILSNAKQQILNDVQAKRSTAKLNVLEGQLNRAFYPIGSTAISTDYFNQRASDATEQNIVEIFNNFNFEDNKTGQYNAKIAISPNTLSSSLKSAAIAIQTIIEKIGGSESLTSFQHLNSLIEQARKLIKSGENILNTAERSLQFGQERITGTDFEQALEIINQLNAFSKMLATTDFISPQEAGILFEEALALTNFIDDSTDSFISEELRDISKKAQFGSQLISRGNSGLISYSISSNLIGKEQAKSKQFKLNKGNMSVTYSYNPSEARQGKMDVQLRYNASDKENYRVSAKRWTRGYGDLGETSIDAGITRAAGQSVAEAYKFAVLTPKKDWANNETPTYLAAQAAHDFAIIALKSDIAMGLNQGKNASGAGYANVLVIDTGSSIKVRDLATMVIDNNYKLSRYNASDIEQTANNIYSSMLKIQTGRTQSYLGLMTSSLNKMKVTMNLSVKK